MEVPANKQKDVRQEMLTTAENFAAFLVRKNPFITLLGISGSVSNPKISRHDDIDFFVITKQGRVWECFAACLWYGFQESARLKKPRTFFCFNYLIDENFVQAELCMSPQEMNELLNVHVLTGSEIYKNILRQKKEVGEIFPHEYRRKLADNYKDIPLSTKPSGWIFMVIKPFFYGVAKYLEKRRRKKYREHPIYSDKKIYSHAQVIRSNLYE